MTTTDNTRSSRLPRIDEPEDEQVFTSNGDDGGIDDYALATLFENSTVHWKHPRYSV